MTFTAFILLNAKLVLKHWYIILAIKPTMPYLCSH